MGHNYRNKKEASALRKRRERIKDILCGKFKNIDDRLEWEQELFEVTCQLAWVTEFIDNHPELEDVEW
jgi:hypothetical protein